MRRLVEELERAFENVHEVSWDIIENNEFSLLVRKHETLGWSPCELVVRSAAKVEQSCGGITTRLWDDPFEWTLAESFPGKEVVFTYLDEVASARARVFKTIRSDRDLTLEIPAPLKLQTLFAVLIESLTSSSQLVHMALVALESIDRNKTQFEDNPTVI